MSASSVLSKRPLRACHVLIIAATSVASAGIASAATYTISTTGSNSTTAVGQNFSPKLEAMPNPGLSDTSPVSLTSFNFTKGGAGTGGASTRLVVLDGAFYDTNGGDGTFQPTVANARAISTNSIDTASAASGAPLNFVFSNASLMFGSNYTVAFATVGAGNVLSFTPVNVRYADYAETSSGSGVFLPTTNYGGSNNFNATTLYSDFNGDGFFEADSNTADTVFTATFETVPEPASLAVLAASMTLLARRRK